MVNKEELEGNNQQSGQLGLCTFTSTGFYQAIRGKLLNYSLSTGKPPLHSSYILLEVSQSIINAHLLCSIDISDMLRA